MATRVQCSHVMFPIFFLIQSHMKYQKLLLKDLCLCQEVQMPETLMNYVTTHESFSVSGKKKGEKVLILCMRTLKQLLPPGDVNS